MKPADPHAAPLKLQFDPSRREVEEFFDLQLGLVGLKIDAVADELDAVYRTVADQFAKIRSKYFMDGDGPVLRLAHNAQLTILLYCLSRMLLERKRRPDADRVYWLLRMVSGVDLFYEVVLPALWACDHPLGSVIGRGRFSRRATLFFAQNCNIGNNRGIYPLVDGNLHMFANSSLLGEAHVIGNVVLANGACAVDAGMLSDCTVFGRSPDLVIKPLTADAFRQMSLFMV